MASKYRYVTSVTGTPYYLNADYVIALRHAHDQHPPKLLVAELSSSGARGEIELKLSDVADVAAWLESQ